MNGHRCGKETSETNSVPLSLNNDESFITTVSVIDATNAASDCSCNSYVTALTSNTPLPTRENRATVSNNDPYDVINAADFRDEPDGESLTRSTHGSIDSGNGPSPEPAIETSFRRDSDHEGKWIIVFYSELISGTFTSLEMVMVKRRSISEMKVEADRLQWFHFRLDTTYLFRERWDRCFRCNETAFKGFKCFHQDLR